LVGLAAAAHPEQSENECSADGDEAMTTVGRFWGVVWIVIDGEVAEELTAAAFVATWVPGTE
jgi:hypothetical protein